MPAAEATFASRGDDSGTHTKEVALWDKAEVTIPEGAAWYKSLGQGMGETLLFANETGAYTLTDRGTLPRAAGQPPQPRGDGRRHVHRRERRPGPVEPLRGHPGEPGGIDAELAQDFADWITSVDTQEMIQAYGRDEFGQSLFYPDSEAWNNR